MVEVGHIGSLSGEFERGFLSYIYFSAATYSSLGIGDIFPKGPLRFVTGVEVLNGLVLIAWSASFTYLTMEKFWNLHLPKCKK
ncbi:MAG: ion channel [Rickettsiales bacterium]|nr:ion channel [Rickettsiales bacterium]